MKKSTSLVLIVLVQALLLIFAAFAAATVDSPHYDEASGLVCTTCHTVHLTLGSTGYNNTCQNCHRPGDPAAGGKPLTLADAANPYGIHSTDSVTKTYQTSHRWDGSTTNPQAGAQPPVQAQMTDAGLLARTGGQLACVSCHNQHTKGSDGKFLRMANDQDQMCLDCHRSRNTTDHTKGTHPVGVTYDGTKAGFKPIAANSENSSANLNNYLKNGTVSCSTCHGVHFTDSRSSTADGSANFANLSSGDGYILRVSPFGKSASDLNICTNCHSGKLNHNLSLRGGKPAAQCNHCHSGHVEFDAAAVGAETTPNVYLVRRYLTYTTAGRISKRIIYNSTTTKNFYSASGGGVCQSCHNPPSDHLSGTAVESNHFDCTACHTHNDPAGTFSAGAGGCTGCHGQPPSASGSGSPTGKAAGYTTFDESLTPHASHAGGTQYNYSCSQCHAGNTHNSGSTFTDVFKSTADILAGTTATYAAPTCSSVYCHSSGRGTYKNVSWGHTKGTIIGQTSECTACHDSTTYSSSHDKHITVQSYGCVTCHAATVSSNSTLLAAAKLAGGTHVNGTKDVQFSGVAPATGTSCATVWCHGGNTSLLPQNNPARTEPAWGTPFPTNSTLGTGGPAGTSGSGYCAQCHGYPPLTVSHSGKTASTCTGCHSHINSDALTFNDKTKHVNGTVDANGHVFPYSGALHRSQAGTTPWSSCSGCHTTNAAGGYPVAAGTAPNCLACHIGGLKTPSGTSSCYDCHGATATDGLPNGKSFPNISGSHTIHAAISGTVCATCHSGGGSGSVTHGSSNRVAASPASVKVAFTGQGASPLWTLATKTCSATNCHGQGAPTWGASAAAPVSGFPYSTTQCTKCHGSAATNPFYSTAIPKVTTITDAKVGAHSDHLSGSKNISSAIACLECHAVPATVTAAGHMDGTTQVVYNGTLAKANSSTATTCATTWCHGGNTALIPQNSPARTAPVWGTRFPTTSTLGTGGTTGTSGSGYCAQCHGYPPLTGNHANKTASTCIGCHPHINSDALTFNDKTKHVNGIIEANGHAFPYPGSLHMSAAGTTPWSSCTVCHTNASGSYPVAAGAAPNCLACHTGGLKTPSGTSSCWDCHGDTATVGLPSGTSFPNVAGSHAAHTVITTVCATCHNGGGSGSATHGSSNRIAASAASVTVAFTGQGTSPRWTFATKTCSATNCHGQGAPVWGTSLWSTTDQCGKCHSSTAAGAVTVGVPFYSTAYPGKVTANTDAKVGAHTAHVSASENLHPALVCADCHGTVNLNDATHMNGSTTFNWGTLSKTGNLSPSYDPTTGKCSNVYCHGGHMPGGDTSGSNRTPTWYNPSYLPTTLTVAGCGTCHGFPPSASVGHPAVTIPAGFPTTVSIGTTCSCHDNINPAGNSYANIFIDNTKHINGTLEGAACNSCHGYPPAKAGFSGTAGNWENARTEDYLGGGGAHTINGHVSKTAKFNDGFAFCNKCHSASDHATSPTLYKPSTNIKVNIDQRYRMESTKQARYTSNRLDSTTHVPGKCSNISCHFGATPVWNQ